MDTLTIKKQKEVPLRFVDGYFHKMQNQIFKLLPLREENNEWEKHLNTLLIELYGAVEVFPSINFISVLCKLEALRYLEFDFFRKTVFETMNLVGTLRTATVSGDCYVGTIPRSDESSGK